MNYKANFKDIDMTPFEVQILTDNGGTPPTEITLADPPCIIETSSSGLFSPIKSRSCTVNILSTEGLFDLYTLDPQGVRVTVSDISPSNPHIVFNGYATPMVYNQNWTSMDVISLECVDLLSSLKDIQYVPFHGTPQYITIFKLISYLLSMMTTIDGYNITWYWPSLNFESANGASFSSTVEFLESVKLNEANFFDDDDEHTPWSCYEVLEEVCKFMNVSLVPFENHYFFVDYHNVVTEGTQRYGTWMCDLEDNYQYISIDKDLQIYPTMYAGGTSELSTDECYQYISIDTNRYDISQLADDVFDKKNHINITKTQNFGGEYQIWTDSETNGWWIFSNTQTHKTYVYKIYSILNSSIQQNGYPTTGWEHTWWSPRSMLEITSFYSTAMNGYSDYINVPENKYINTIGATIVEYTDVDSQATKPVKLDWNKAIMFNCLTDTIRPASTNTMGRLTYGDLFNGTFEKPVLKYTQPYEMNYSPSSGTSWITLCGKLWYQQNFSYNNTNYVVTDTISHVQAMMPIDNLTDAEPYPQQLKETINHGTSTVTMRRPESSSQYGKGWRALKVQVKIGDKYWDGTKWTETPSTFFISFTSQYEEDGVKYDAFRYLTWMDMVSNSDYEDKVGVNGYCIPITSSDAICGQLEVTIYTPRVITYDAAPPSNFYNVEIDWYRYGPVVFMKDFDISYVYTDSSEWYLNEEALTDDLKYTNTTKSTNKSEKSDTWRINTWQDKRPIAKSFPILSFWNGKVDINEYIKQFTDDFGDHQAKPQEANVIDRMMRHYNQPTKIYTCNLNQMVPPWSKVSLSSGSHLDGDTYVVDSQQYDVRNRNTRVKLIEFGNTNSI